eukprot:TRINITY_DN10082_c0_g2_i3.p1 TRINITY_DN10082_c0_g2~~TRINITY_DN10082_c0_g2_i3.p1  ORF type:complete len:246 (+),score=29.76 TRINITY_DN10082_c0_g2_i3:94-831(+)
MRINNFGGKRLTECFVKLYDGKCYFRDLTPFSCLDQVKCNLCYLSEDFKKDMEACLKNPNPYRKPWHFANTHYFSSELFFVPEALFQPKMILMDVGGLPEQILQLIAKCPLDCKLEMYKNIVLAGGSSLFPGLSSRLYKAIESKSPDRNFIRDFLLQLHGQPDSRLSFLPKDTIHKIAFFVGPLEIHIELCGSTQDRALLKEPNSNSDSEGSSPTEKSGACCAVLDGAEWALLAKFGREEGTLSW